MQHLVTKILVPAGALGISYDRKALEAGLRQHPDLIAIDGGSTDSGPYYLGTGTSKYSRNATKTDWAALMAARAKINTPLLIGTAGTCGTDSAVDWMLDITLEIARERGEKLKIATLKSNQPVQSVLDAFESGQLTPLDGAPEFDRQKIANATHIVALAGVEPIQSALATGADIIIAGRATDTAVIAALPLARGCHKGAAWHGAKIAECGALATTNPNSGVIMMSFDQTGFTITPMADDAQATPYTVSAHMLYENTDPHILYEPGGYLNVTQARYHAVTDKSVRVEGSVWHTTTPYTVKLEAAGCAGYQTVSLVLVRDSYYRAHITDWVEKLNISFAEKAIKNGLTGTTLHLRVIGKNATLGDLETVQDESHQDNLKEVGVLAIFTSDDQKTAHEAAKLLNPDLLHLPLTEHEPMPTFAFPFSPPEMDRGKLYEFCLHHVLALDDPLAPFRLQIHES